ncbi:MAG: flagellar motor protein PomA [Pseudomonadota bacterium]
MDLATLLGLIGSAIVIFVVMKIGGDFLVFYDFASIVMVFGGTLCAVLIKFTLAQFINALKVAAKAFKFNSINTHDLINEIVAIAESARKEGLLSLEGRLVSHPFLDKGIQLLVDGNDPHVVRENLVKEMKQSAARHERGARIFNAIGDVAPAMGMIGTLIGLVQMLGAMDDPDKIGPAMAVALLTTFYGAVLANLVALPIADKLRNRSEEEVQIQNIIIDAIIAIQAGQNPRVIKAFLQNYLPATERVRENQF